MDLDALATVHREEWTRLDELGRRRRLSAAEADELVDLYAEVATHLSLVRSQAPDAEVIAYLSAVLARARSRQTGTRATSWRAVGDFFLRRFPAALYRTRWWWVTTAVLNVTVAFLMGWWLLRHPEVETGLVGAEQARQIVSEDFENYYSTYAASSFAAQVWTNNAWVAALCIGLGVFGAPVVWVLLQNIANLALMGSVMVRHDRGELFFGLILPHGLLELTAVFVAAGVGLRVFWSWVRPGDVSRAQSLAREGRSAAGVAIGLVVVLLVSGLIEAFVTPSPLPTWARIAIGVVAEAAFLAYVWVVGGAAARAGETGDVDADLLEAGVATAA